MYKEGVGDVGDGAGVLMNGEWTLFCQLCRPVRVTATAWISTADIYRQTDRQTDRWTDTSTRYNSSLSHAHTIVIDSEITVDISWNSRENTRRQTTEMSICVQAFQFSRVHYWRTCRCWVQAQVLGYTPEEVTGRRCLCNNRRTWATNKMWLF